MEMATQDMDRTGTEPTDVTPWQHEHVFGQDRKMPGEFRTLIVIVITAATMVLEIVAGVVFGSMALLADGLHMASHASALAISLFAYVYARRHAHDERFCFGTGKVNSLAGFTGAVLLALFALLMAWESAARLLTPVTIAFNQAIGVAVLGLIVNGLSVFVLGGGDPHDHLAGSGLTDGDVPNRNGLRATEALDYRGLHGRAETMTAAMKPAIPIVQVIANARDAQRFMASLL